MRSAISFAIVSGVVLALFLWLRPIVGRLGDPQAPDARGRASLPETAAITAVAPPAPLTPKPAAAPVTAEHRADLEQQVLDLTNEERRRNGGLPPLALEEVLRQTAREHNADMLSRGYFDHVNPDGEGPEDRIARVHRRLVGVTGENIWTASGRAADTPDLARMIVDDWMSSPGHRANILKPEYTHLGVGISVAAGNEIRATQNFARIRAYLAAPLPATAKPAANLDLTLAAPHTDDAELFDIWSPQRGLAVAGPTPVAAPKLDVEPGVYRLRLYFRKSDGRAYTIFSGPRIEVE